ncbi:hypothetical protein CTAM01_09022 [Colletotrichum tamarilloi]|uniref:Uncharacterized protein n=1 Tax=Colletotrichum tamarilloi TaxID=1209934 RepID=A0ABQ9R443_9PEZI|nr:uncharacterized protein CTAM01_09022 [Colletotrichum tamarilloi]KAK1494141.1 hypothetical protein CTAM01_09022 [Colletotrichum tamarilloi]
MSPVVVRMSLQGPEKQLAPAGRWRLSPSGVRHAERVCEAPNPETAKHGKTSHEARLSPQCATDLPPGKEKNTGAKPVISDTHIYNAEAWKGEWEEKEKEEFATHDLKIPALLK